MVDELSAEGEEGVEKYEEDGGGGGEGDAEGSPCTSAVLNEGDCNWPPAVSDASFSLPSSLFVEVERLEVVLLRRMVNVTEGSGE